MIGYLDLPSGISGDMLLSCLVDAGWSIDDLRAVIAKLGLTEKCPVEAKPVKKGPLAATQVNVHAAHEHHHRHLGDVRKIIESADLPAPVKERAIAVFARLAAAEAKVHGTSVDHVHFHEVGAVDAIVDIVGNVAGLNALGIDKLYAGPLPLGAGWAKTDHGMIPLPAPATLELLAAAGAPTRPAPGPGELVTPTGAAIVAELATFAQPPMKLSRIATGAGQKDFAWPNVARLWLGEPGETGPIVQIETNIDDMNPQLYAPVTESLFAAGALDVWLTPVQMKKGRPGVVLSALAPAAREAAISDALLRQTTTLGTRSFSVRREEAGREWRTVHTDYGDVRIKLKRVGEEVCGAMPEYEDCAKLAAAANVPVRVVYEAAIARLKAWRPIETPGGSLADELVRDRR